MKNLLLAADGSEHSIRAAQKAVELAKLSGDAKITIVYAIDGATSKADVLHNTDKLIIEKKRKEKLQEVEDTVKQAGIEVELKMLQGEPGPTIVDFANEHDFEYVIIGSRGLNKLQSMVLGSVSHKVAKRVQAPVMIVK
ncbi:universal stress protein [Desertibacillus haloalkaliphilus]|uniref:universal stress protein n=1 Tax=Desertibacillus haloalkaliphilus TaxID=1328930 RepID=UPI0028B18505|nr:universal stress protein [Desertibacillus haloalkaliphilus]